MGSDLQPGNHAMLLPSCLQNWALRTGVLLLIVGLSWLGLQLPAARADEGPSTSAREQIERTITASLESYQVPGASIAVVRDFKIEWSAAFGKLSAGGSESVTPTTRFQAASISKPVTAAAILTLVQAGQLDLNAPANSLLKSWQIPPHDVAKDPITLRQLLSHSGGLTVHGFQGYSTNAPRPTLLEILDGTKPANSPAVRPHLRPGYRFSYSGGGYQILQQILADTTGVPFPTFMHDRVLEPLGMDNSAFEQPLAEQHASQAAAGHLAGNRLVEGNWHVHPELAAAGLWTTPTDLCRFLIDLENSYAHGTGKLLSQATAKQMMSLENKVYGLGLMVKGEGRTLQVAHGGGNVGYRCMLIGYPNQGTGLAIMTNSDTGDRLNNSIVSLAVKLYGWTKP